MKILYTKDINFKDEFELILNRAKCDIKNVSKIVNEIIDDIIDRKNSALFEHIAKFDGWSPQKNSDLEISVDDMKRAYDNLDPKLKKSLHLAYDRIESFHQKQLPKSWIDFEDNGTILGQKVTPVDSAGLYIPGGKAAYPSSLLMNAIPALVAGVKEI
ncbi:MAG: histidinol dehydrogenase, partial [Arcobacteraceae bacterium]|nr:histidinol dehydrogenase [Arcobacteraceae bacterium]